MEPEAEATVGEEAQRPAEAQAEVGAAGTDAAEAKAKAEAKAEAKAKAKAAVDAKVEAKAAADAKVEAKAAAEARTLAKTAVEASEEELAPLSFVKLKAWLTKNDAEEQQLNACKNRPELIALWRTVQQQQQKLLHLRPRAQPVKMPPKRRPPRSIKKGVAPPPAAAVAEAAVAAVAVPKGRFEMIKFLKQKTGKSFGVCKAALQSHDDDLAAATTALLYSQHLAAAAQSEGAEAVNTSTSIVEAVNTMTLRVTMLLVLLLLSTLLLVLSALLLLLVLKHCRFGCPSAKSVKNCETILLKYINYIFLACTSQNHLTTPKGLLDEDFLTQAISNQITTPNSNSTSFFYHILILKIYPAQFSA